MIALTIVLPLILCFAFGVITVMIVHQAWTEYLEAEE